MIATGKISAALSWLHGSHLEASKNPKAEAAPPTCEIRVLRIFQCLARVDNHWDWRTRKGFKMTVVL